MPRVIVQDTVTATAATDVREKLHKLEVALASLKGSGLEALELLKLRDQVEADLRGLEERGLDVRPERGRADTVDGTFYRKSGRLSRELAKIGGLAGARQRENPPEEHWWWYGDVYQGRQHRKSLIRSLVVVAVIVAVVLVGNYVMEYFFGMSPLEKEAYEHTSTGQQLLLDGDYKGAVIEFEQAVALTPGNGETWAELGVLYEILGRQADAQEALLSAEEAMGDRLDYLLALARAYNSIGLFDKAVVACGQALEIDPESPYAYFFRATAYELTGDRNNAIQDLELAAKYADQREESELYVLARSRLGMLLQSGAGLGLFG